MYSIISICWPSLDLMTSQAKRTLDIVQKWCPKEVVFIDMYSHGCIYQADQQHSYKTVIRQSHFHEKKEVKFRWREQRTSGQIQRKLAPEEIALPHHSSTQLTSFPELKIKHSPQEAQLLRSRFADARTGSNGKPTGPSATPKPGIFKIRRGTC